MHGSGEQVVEVLGKFPDPEKFPGPHPSLTGCPTKQDWVQVNIETGTVMPLRCEVNRCPWCGPRRAVRVVGAIELAKPDWGFTLTGLSTSWEVNHPLLSKVIRSLQAKYTMKVAWHLEENPQGRGCHLHGWGRGDRPDEAIVSMTAASAGLGSVVSVDPVRGNFGYGMKEITALHGETDVTVIQPRLDRYLDRNGGRLVHSSRGFWLDRAGRPTDLRGALGESARQHHGSPSVDSPIWVRCLRSEVDKIREGRW